MYISSHAPNIKIHLTVKSHSSLQNYGCSALKLLHVTHLDPRIKTWSQNFLKSCGPLPYTGFLRISLKVYDFKFNLYTLHYIHFDTAIIEHDSFFWHKCTYSIYYVLYGFPFTNLKHNYPHKCKRTHKITNTIRQYTY